MNVKLIFLLKTVRDISLFKIHLRTLTQSKTSISLKLSRVRNFETGQKFPNSFVFNNVGEQTLPEGRTKYKDLSLTKSHFRISTTGP